MLNLNVIRKNFPHTPGVYLFKNINGDVIYVGKAIDLYRRVNSYFQKNHHDAKTEILVKQIAEFEVIKVVSEFDALLLEAKLIRQYLPKYNIIAKDDKSSLYVVLTLSEDLPRLLFLRKTQLLPFEKNKNEIFGPFQSGRIARSLFRQLRSIISYCTQKQRNGKPCFYTHLGLCLPCPSVIIKLTGEEKNNLTRQYRRSFFQLRDILSGKSTAVIHDLEKEMHELSKQQRFEEASQLQKQIQGLYDLIQQKFDPARFESETSQFGDIRETELTDLQQILLPYCPSLCHPDQSAVRRSVEGSLANANSNKPRDSSTALGMTTLKRIECIDISNFGGKEAVGSLVVLTDGVPDTSQYRRFKILKKNVPNDFAMIAEVVSRRFKHPEWPLPDLLVIDGGKGQISSALGALNQLNLTIPVIGLAKRYEEIIIPLTRVDPSQERFKTIRVSLTRPGIHVLQRVRDEAHRFAIRYHKKLRHMSFRGSPRPRNLPAVN